MFEPELNIDDKINVINAHLREMKLEQYSHELRKIEFEAAGLENIDTGLYNQYINMIEQYEVRMQALRDLKNTLS